MYELKSRSDVFNLYIDLIQFKDDIESHNQSYNLDNYSNQKRGKPSIKETIKLAELTLDGLD